MSVVIKTGLTVKVIKVTAADFNGHDFDGSPFEFGTVTSAEAEALKSFLQELHTVRQFKISQAYAETDYAVWDYTDSAGNTVVLMPGDRIIICENGKHFSLTAHAYEQLFEQELV